MDPTEMRHHAERIVAGIEKRTDATGRQYELREPRAFLFGLMEPYELATTFLAEHPADDELPVTREWLQSIGSKSVPSFLGDNYDDHEELHGLNFWEFNDDHWLFSEADRYPIRTRRQFRQLLAGLGIATEAAP